MYYSKCFYHNFKNKLKNKFNMNLRRGTNRVCDKLESDLRTDILCGRLNPGDALHTETEFMSMYGISRNSVRMALGHLEAEGLLERRRGSGSYVSQKVEHLGNERKASRQILFLSMETTLSDDNARNTFLPVFAKLSSQLSERSYNLLFCSVGLDLKPPVSLVNKDVCAVIFHGDMPYDFWKTYIYPLPSVGLQFENPELDCNWVRIDYYSRSFQAVRYLHSLGHQRIGFFSNEIESYMQNEFFHGYLKAMKYFGLKVDERWAAIWQRPRVDGVLTTELEPVGYWEHLRPAFASKAECPTALICLDDPRAEFCKRVLEENGFSVPQDVSIIGGSNSSNGLPAPFTGFGDRLNEICLEALSILWNEIEGENPIGNKTVLMRPLLTIGKSTAQVKKR